MVDIPANLARLHDAIAAAAHSVERDPEEIKLVAVSKTHPAESIEAALAAGQRAFGENVIQEALPKIAHFAASDRLAATGAAVDAIPEWHFIGHLQSNKVRFVPGNFSWIHSIDSLKLAQRLSRFARERRAPINALIEVNIAHDPNKHGVAPDTVMALLDQLCGQDLPAVTFRGLMAIGPYPASEADIRRAYAALRRLRDDCAHRFALETFTELSMGMSGDYVEAIKEGATLLRIGTAIFGERSYRESAR
jgi:pyridoxal phosphate enzyme (YggS family)